MALKSFLCARARAGQPGRGGTASVVGGIAPPSSSRAKTAFGPSPPLSTPSSNTDALNSTSSPALALWPSSSSSPSSSPVLPPPPPGYPPLPVASPRSSIPPNLKPLPINQGAACLDLRRYTPPDGQKFVQIHNRCSGEVIYPGMIGQGGSSVPPVWLEATAEGGMEGRQEKGWRLKPGDCRTLTIPATFPSLRLWGRTGCNGSTVTDFKCQTG
ncbi:hypothetical protein NSK_008202 [Nannochloropsis salina CCMP1776]|uniref:Uncharacterized protein n=1 Tax=Nannochloropsis salina CCMP1776 TaxID=1027361 RepID=A0A4D9CMV6_9STRA|nr:hypothetical protein NSK_008202 [Nannochloropsis salina CCMP1776]|eukprot:TFJ80461.1 hypothetical protein NSK_008202 [Nannochloropsis salina CCMP1776]